MSNYETRVRPAIDQPYYADDEINLRQLFVTLWHGKWIVIAATTLFAVAGVFYALSKPNLYQASVLLAPPKVRAAPAVSVVNWVVWRAWRASVWAVVVQAKLSWLSMCLNPGRF